MRTRKFTMLARMMVIVTAVTGTTLINASAAQAWPTGCSAGVDIVGGWSYCSGGTGMHRIDVECQGFPFRIYWRSSGWMPVGRYAHAYCDDFWPFQTTTGYYALYRSNS